MKADILTISELTRALEKKLLPTNVSGFSSTVENLFTKVSFELLILNFSVLVLSKQKHMNDMETTREIFWTS
jgi:hypothetical protein